MIIVFLLSFLVLGVEPRALCALESTILLRPPSALIFALHFEMGERVLLSCLGWPRHCDPPAA